MGEHLHNPRAQMNANQWLEKINELGKDMVCNSCGFGYFAQAYAIKMVPSILHPQPIPGHEAPITVHDFWMCIKCGKYHKMADLTVLEKPSDDSKGKTLDPPLSDNHRAERIYLDTPCPVCGCELYSIDGEVFCPKGCTVSKD